MAQLAAPFVAIALAGEAVDALVYRHLKMGAGAVEKALAANPNLAELGPLLPAGTEVVLPVAATRPQARPMTQLWS